MATGISDFGNGLGYLYMTNIEADRILGVAGNTVEGARNMREAADRNAPLAGGRAAVATITITGCASVGAVTNITIAGVNQIAANVNCATNNTTIYAAQIVAAINAFTPGSGYNYTASNLANVITVFAPEAAGSSVNGLAITVSVSSGTITFTTTTFVNGSDVGGTFDKSLGFRFFMNADYGPAGIPGSTPATPDSLLYAIEITKYITLRGMETGNDVQTIIIVAGRALGIQRKSAITMIKLETEGAAASDELTYIDTTDFVEGDVLVLRCYDPTHVVTVNDSLGAGENIGLSLDTPFDLDSTTAIITLYFSNDPVDGAFFYEMTRTNSQTAVPSQKNIRAAGVPMGKQGVTTTTLVAAGTTITLTPNVSKQVQYLIGAATLSSSYTIAFDTTGAIDGDEFWVLYYATMALAANTITIGGYSLTDDQANGGGIMVYGKYDSTAGVYRTQLLAAPDIAQYGLADTLIVPVSFETGYQGSNKLEMPYKGRVLKINAFVVKAIAATDNATITGQINAVNITTGVITIPASSANGFNVSVTPTAANTFLAGDTLDLISAKSTAGGTALVSVKIQRRR